MILLGLLLAKVSVTCDYSRSHLIEEIFLVDGEALGVRGFLVIKSFFSDSFLHFRLALAN